MTTMPILQSAPPASSSRPPSGSVAPATAADTPDIPNAANIANNPNAANAAKTSSSSTAPSTEAGNTPESFADALQRQLAQTSSTDAPVPESLRLPGLALLIQPASSATAGISIRPATGETLLGDFSGLADRQSSSADVPAVSGDPVATELIQDLPAAADLNSNLSNAKIVPEHLRNPAVADLVPQAPQGDKPAVIDAVSSDPTPQWAGSAKEDDGPREMPPDGLASIASFVQSLQPRESVKPEPEATADDTSPSGSGLPLTPALAAAVMAQSNIDKEPPPATTSEISAAAGRSAEFAATQTILAEAPSSNTGQSRSSVPEQSFEALLAAAQTFSQHRNNGVLAANTPGVPLPVHTPVGTRGWDGEISDKLVWMVGRQEQRAELVLNPPQMGRIEVSISVNDGQTSALFASANPAVRDALEAALPRLREILADAGINLGQTQVGADTGNNAGNSSTNSAENRDNPRRDLSKDQPPPGDKILRQLDAPQWLKRGNGLVDTFA
ncbi:MAG: flagellar hook-length control protein FliK [Sterolibacterium sp.]